MELKQEFKSRVNLDSLKKMSGNIKEKIGGIVIGQDDMIEQIMIALLTDGHILIEGVPGIAKTLTAKLFAKSISADFSRIQFTPDLMPSDVTGTSVFNMSKSSFEFKKGPIFGNIILIDEVNRAPAKTQAALIEVMEERQVTVDGITYIMEEPFIVFATQNPIEQEGTYRLPEAQLDRFLFKINVDYPSTDDEITILKNSHARKGAEESASIEAFITKEEIALFRQQIKELYIDENLIKYIAEIISKTRNNNDLFLGASPRASLNIMTSSKAMAAINGRDFVIPDDIKAVAYPVLRHRLILTPEKEMEGVTVDKVIKKIIDKVEVPR
ncbi:MAG: MoxR family ATPase [Bacteroidales bacterium]|nr:MoxR family ATPase [Bacteroidales bacterium]